MRPYRTSKLHEKPSALKREHPALQNMKFLFFLWVIFALLDPLGVKKFFYFFEHTQRTKLLLAPLK
jgi:hypothetical protein